jgi:hypothetical protein
LEVISGVMTLESMVTSSENGDIVSRIVEEAFGSVDNRPTIKITTFH